MGLFYDDSRVWNAISELRIQMRERDTRERDTLDEVEDEQLKISLHLEAQAKAICDLQLQLAETRKHQEEHCEQIAQLATTQENLRRTAEDALNRILDLVQQQEALLNSHTARIDNLQSQLRGSWDEFMRDRESRPIATLHAMKAAIEQTLEQWEQSNGGNDQGEERQENVPHRRSGSNGSGIPR